MIRVYELRTPNHVYYDYEPDKHADIIQKHKKYKFAPELLSEIDSAELTILHEVKNLKSAEELTKFYKKLSEQK